MAARGAGLRGNRHQPDGRYYMLLRQYKQSNGKPVDSCKQLTGDNMEDFLAVCESMGWVHPRLGPHYYQDKIRRYARHEECLASYGSRAAIKHLAGDLGMTADGLKAFIRRMTGGTYETVTLLGHEYAWKVIEALKAMLSRKDGVNYETLDDVKEAYGSCTKN